MIIKDKLLINSSKLFHWSSSLNNNTKLKIVNWFNNLTPEEQEYIHKLRHEAALDGYAGK